MIHTSARIVLALTLAAFPLAAQTPQYEKPSEATPHGSAPGMEVKLLASNSSGQKDYAVIFRPGDNPFVGLTQFAAQYQVRSAHFTGIGGFHDAKLAWLDHQKMMFRVNTFDQYTEVASLTGNISLANGKPSVHMHCVLAFDDGTTRGGHIVDAHVSPLLEVFVTTDPTVLVKKHDAATGLSLVDPGATGSAPNSRH